MCVNEDGEIFLGLVRWVFGLGGCGCKGRAWALVVRGKGSPRARVWGERKAEAARRWPAGVWIQSGNRGPPFSEKQLEKEKTVALNVTIHDIDLVSCSQYCTMVSPLASVQIGFIDFGLCLFSSVLLPSTCSQEQSFPTFQA